MEYVCYCKTVAQCYGMMHQFLTENKLSASCARTSLIPYRVDLPDGQVVWFVPEALWARWYKGRHNIAVIYGTPPVV